MTASTTLTVRLTPAVKQQLGRLADASRYTSSFLAAETIAAYVAREGEVIAGIERSRDDMRAGRVIPHEEAMARAEATVVMVERDAD